MTDDYGLQIPLPDEDTPDYELRPLLRDALNTVARLISQLPAAPDLAPLTRRLDEQLAGLQEQLTAFDSRLSQQPAPAGASRHADLQEQIADLSRRLDEQQQLASPGRLLANFAQQLTALENNYETERSARITADAQLRADLIAEYKLALLERGL